MIFSVETDTDGDYAEDTTYSVLRGNNLSFWNNNDKKRWQVIKLESLE